MHPGMHIGYFQVECVPISTQGSWKELFFNYNAKKNPENIMILHESCVSQRPFLSYIVKNM